MKLHFLRLFMLISSTLSVIGCGRSSQNNDVSGNVQTRIPAPGENGAYSLQIFDLLGIDSLAELGGSYAHFYLAPGVLNGHLMGVAPKTRFVKTENLYIAADSLSLQLATVYVHTQRLASLDSELGVGSVNTWPRDIGVAVRLGKGLQNNAFYDGDTDSMLFVPYSGEDLPLAVNAGVLAHEHFHSLFYKLVTVPLMQAGKNPQKVSTTVHSKREIYKTFDLPELKPIDGRIDNEQSAYHILLMRGLNEGLADFWGWLYTGDVNFISYSLPSEKDSRSLKSMGKRRLLLYGKDLMRSRVRVLSEDPEHMIPNLNNDAYTLGTQYSRILKIFTDTWMKSRDLSEVTARKDVARLILKALPVFKQQLMSLKSTEYYEPSDFLTGLLGGVADAKEDECKLLASVLTRNQNQSYTCELKAGAAAWTIKKSVKASKEDEVDLPDQGMRF